MLGRTDRRSLDAALALRDAIMAASPTPVLLFDRSGRLVRANRAARTAIPDLEVGATAAVQQIATAVHDALAGRPPRPFDVTVYEPERRRFHAHVRAYADRGARSCAVVLADESAEADYRDARRLFSAGVSHELRTPLARMLALVDTLSLPLDEGERESTMQQMRDEIDAMRDLIEDMMLLAQLESEGVPDGGATDVADAIDVCTDGMPGAAQAAGLTLTGEAAGGLVGGSVAAAVRRRARQPGRERDPPRRRGRERRGAGTGTGRGGRAGGVGHRRRRAQPSTCSASSSGSTGSRGRAPAPAPGLGLAIVKHIAESHGGRAVMESSEGTAPPCG